MSTLVYKIRFRPVRVGWCIANGDFEALTKAFSFSHCLWGGRFNPIIVVDDESSARHLIDLFHVDLLLPIGEDKRCQRFAESIKHLPGLLFQNEVFQGGGSDKDCVLLDLYHPIRKFFEHYVKDKPSPKHSTTLFRWADNDPCARVNEHPFGSQHLVVTLKTTLSHAHDDKFLFTVPCIPELNDYFGAEHHFDWYGARAEKEGIGIITRLWTEYITLRGMERSSFAKELFKAFGIAAEVSQPGLVCDQLIRQMGGLQGCRVFKIRGVRRLIEQFGPNQDFFWSDAMKFINYDPDAKCADFANHQSLYLEPRDKPTLEPKDAFDYLLKQGVFRVGLKLKCSSCQLSFWKALDDVKSFVICEYCGREFNTTLQLRDRRWAYRPSGLFGRDDHQEGGVPVALTLQQLDTALHNHSVVWLPAMKLEPLTASIEKCETDFVLLCQDWHGRVKLVIGECKANKEITADDIGNLSKVADAFPANRFDVFIVFSKSGQFKPEEIERCRIANSNGRTRTILLSERELEPYSIYERAEKEFEIERSVISLDDMAEATRWIYFEPRPKARSSTSAT